jgi:hypothetical protein
MSSFCSSTAAESVHGRLATQGRFGQSSTAVGAPSSGAPALRTSPVAAMLVGAPPPSGESTWETQIRWLDDSNAEMRLGLGANHTGKASIYTGIQSTHRQGRLRTNLGSNRLEIMVLEVGFDRGSKLS